MGQPWLIIPECLFSFWAFVKMEHAWSSPPPPPHTTATSILGQRLQRRPNIKNVAIFKTILVGRVILHKELSLMFELWQMAASYAVQIKKTTSTTLLMLEVSHIRIMCQHICQKRSIRVIMAGPGLNIPADKRRWINVCLTLVHRLRRWSNVEPALIQRLVSSEIALHQ